MAGLYASPGRQSRHRAVNETARHGSSARQAMMTVKKHFHSTGACVFLYNRYSKPETNSYTNFRVRQTKAKRSRWQYTQPRARRWGPPSQQPGAVRFHCTIQKRLNPHLTNWVIPCSLNSTQLWTWLSDIYQRHPSTLCACQRHIEAVVFCDWR